MIEFLHIYQPGFTDEPGSYMPPIVEVSPILPKLETIVYNSFEGKSFIASEYLLLDNEVHDAYCGEIDDDDLEGVKICVYYYELKDNPDFQAIERELKLNGILKK